MSSAGFLSTSVRKALALAQSGSLWFFSTGAGCCADEVITSVGCRYDLERFGAAEEHNPSRADLLIINGIVTPKAAPEIRAAFESMSEPRYVMAVGACACSGGLFQAQSAADVIPVDVFVPGCPPRPEAIMNGLITLQEKIVGAHRA